MMNEQQLKLLEGMGHAKIKCIIRLCKILDHRQEKYNVDELIKKTREEIFDLINYHIDYPYQRFDS